MSSQAILSKDLELMTFPVFIFFKVTVVVAVIIITAENQ